MGGGASNLSTADLQVYQSAISEVMQNIQNETSNLTSQQVDLDQEINLQVGTDPPPQNPCNDRVDSVEACANSNCRDLPSLYQCQLKKTSATGPTTVSLCDKAFGYTYEQALDKEGFCSGGTGSTTVSESDLYTICQNKLLRQTCDANPPGSYISWINVSCSSNADCTVGTTCDLNPASNNFGSCGVETPPGSLESTCGGNCGTKTIYQIQYIGQDGKRKFTLDPTITRNDISGIDRCLFEPPSKPGDQCYFSYNLDDYYDCVQVQKERKVPANCSADCKSLYSCTPEELVAFKPEQAMLEVIGGSICLQNKASATFVSTQVAEATTTAILENQITNQFQNDISKTINQLNKGMNFGQENNSQERTSLTQKVRNTVSQSISSSSSNQTVQGDNTTQTINFTIPSGKVRISKDCGTESGIKCVNSNPTLPGLFCPDGGLILSNEAVSQLNANQTATSVVDALLNSNILNDMRNKYSFTASQTNDNDILGGLFNLLMSYILLIVVFAIIALVGAGILAKTSLNFLNSFLDILKNKWFWIAFIILTVLGVGVYLAVAQPWVKTTTTTNPNPSGQTTPSPPPEDPSKPGPSEIECVVNNMAGCKCSIFLQKVEGKTTDELCAPIISQLKTTSTSSIEEQCKSLINIQWGNPPFTFDLDYCKTSQGSACSLRTYSSQTGTRAYCQSPAETTSSAPTK